MTRKIIHVDMDAFYASVEIRDRPELLGKPVIIGGPPQSRGVVATASYEARKFGVRSAMSSAYAYKLCPQGVFLYPNFDKYVEVSERIREIFARYTDQIEPLSLDEAYLDVTDNKLGLRAVHIAQKIRADIQNELSLTCSAGVSHNKLIAKIASDFQKPDGLTVVLPENAQSFMSPLSLRKIHGVGPATAKRLKEVGLESCEDIQKADREVLREQLGERLALWLYDAAHGVDHREVCVERTRKSLGREVTFPKDVESLDVLRGVLEGLCQDVRARLKRKGLCGKSLTIKMKYNDFKSLTRTTSVVTKELSLEQWYEKTWSLLSEKTEAGTRPVRLIGVSVGRLYEYSV